MDVLCLSPSVQQPRGPSLCLGKVSQMFMFSVSPPRCAEHLGFPPLPTQFLFCAAQQPWSGVCSVGVKPPRAQGNGFEDLNASSEREGMRKRIEKCSHVAHLGFISMFSD